MFSQSYPGKWMKTTSLICNKHKKTCQSKKRSELNSNVIEKNHYWSITPTFSVLDFFLIFYVIQRNFGGPCRWRLFVMEKYIYIYKIIIFNIFILKQTPYWTRFLCEIAIIYFDIFYISFAIYIFYYKKSTVSKSQNSFAYFCLYA